MSETKEYWKPSVTADIIVIDSHQAKFRKDGTFINLLLIKRSDKSDAYPNCWALPGGFLDKGESLEQCAVRELKEETGLNALMLLPMGVFSKPDRDPCGQVISSAFLSVFLSTDEQPLPIKAGDDAKDIALFRLKGTFDKTDGSLSVNLRCAANNLKIVFKAKFSRGALGLLKTEVVYDDNAGNARLAFDHAEILARTILHTPDLVLPTKERSEAVNQEAPAEKAE